MSVEPFKYLIQPIAIEWDEEHKRIVREMPAQTVTVYNAAQAAEAITEFEAQLQQFVEQEERRQHVNNGDTAESAAPSEPTAAEEPSAAGPASVR